jgi:hypothetical protein
LRDQYSESDGTLNAAAGPYEDLTSSKPAAVVEDLEQAVSEQIEDREIDLAHRSEQTPIEPSWPTSGSFDGSPKRKRRWMRSATAV